MDARAVAPRLEEIATLQELAGTGDPAAFRAAAKAVLALHGTDLPELIRQGGLAHLPGLTDATRPVVAELAETGDADVLDRLREETPEGLFEMLRVPGLGPSRIRQLREGLGIETLQELEEAARDGRLSTLPRFGERTAEKVLRGIAQLRETGSPVLLPHAQADGRRLLAMVLAHPDVVRAELTGALRRSCEVVRELDIVAECRGNGADVAASFAHAAEVRQAVGTGSRAVTLHYADGVVLRLHCADAAEYPLAVWRTTGSDAHVAAVRRHAASRALRLSGDVLRDADGRVIPIADEPALYRTLGLAYVVPEQRESGDEVAEAAAGHAPVLVEEAMLRGILHCHSHYSDGGPDIRQLAEAARAHGWSYVGITDHSQSNTYAGGLSRDDIRRQHAEIDALNATLEGIRVLKGIEADILPCGRLDYDEALLDSFDYVIGSIHTRFGMNRTQMTDRVLKAMDDPHLTILGHPTGRLLLTREAYDLDVEAVLEKAGRTGVAVELNADPHRLDLDWRWLPAARRHGVRIEIGPDAHSIAGLDHAALGVAMARKGGLSADDVLNTGSADDVLAFARARRGVAAA
jgi:DNA polymerase (family 10)